MYADYIKEREGKEILETEHGFVIYGYNCVPGLAFNHVLIEDIWVKPNQRRAGHMSAMADQVVAEAKARGIQALVGAVDCSANGAHEALQAIMAYGLKLFAANDNQVWLVKEI